MSTLPNCTLSLEASANEWRAWVKSLSNIELDEARQRIIRFQASSNGIESVALESIHDMVMAEMVMRFGALAAMVAKLTTQEAA